MKKHFILAVLLLVATAAVAQVPFNSPIATANINVKATIQQSASISLSSNSVSFDVTDASAPTSGSNDVTINGKASLAKGHSVFMTIMSSDLVGANDGQIIPANLVWGKIPGAFGFSPLDETAYYTPIAFTATNGVLDMTSGLSTTLSLQLAAVPGFVPDQYSGTVTVFLQVM